MLQRPVRSAKPASASVVSGTGRFTASAVGQSLDRFISDLSESMFLELKSAPNEKPVVTPKLGVNKTGATSEQQIMQQYGWFWEPLLHDLDFLAQMRDNIPLLSGSYQKFVDLVMEGFHIECEDPEETEEITDLLINDPQVDFAETVRSAVLQLSTIANAYFKPIYKHDDDGFGITSFRPIKSTAMRKLRDEDLVVRGYVQLLHRPSEFLFGTPTTPTVHLVDEICCGSAYTDGWYAYGVPPLAALPFSAKMKLQMERDLVEMFHQHVPRIDVTYTPDDQLSEDQVKTLIDAAQTQIAALKPTDNYIHTPDYQFEYKGPQGKALDFAPPLRYFGEQLFAVIPLLSGFLSADLAINPIMAQQAFRLTCSLVNYIRTRVNMMFQPAMKKLEDGRDLSSTPKLAFTNLDVDTQETMARTQEYDSQNAATNRDNGFVDQDAAAQHATHKTPGGAVKKAAKPGKIPEPVAPGEAGSSSSPSKTKDKPTTGKPGAPSKGGRSKVKDAGKGPKGKSRSAPTPDKRPKGKRHEDLTLDDRIDELSSLLEQMK